MAGSTAIQISGFDTFTLAAYLLGFHIKSQASPRMEIPQCPWATCSGSNFSVSSDHIYQLSKPLLTCSVQTPNDFGRSPPDSLFLVLKLSSLDAILQVRSYRCQTGVKDHSSRPAGSILNYHSSDARLASLSICFCSSPVYFFSLSWSL